MRLALAICSYCLLLGAAHAESDVNTFLRGYDAATLAERHRMSDYLSSIEIGMSWVNVFIAEDRKEQPLYCPPNTLAPTGEQLVDFLRTELKVSPEEGSRPVGLVLMTALQKGFPCH
jgi:Ssp1 endopeptidase immunity protein Rap1a